MRSVWKWKSGREGKEHNESTGEFDRIAAHAQDRSSENKIKTKSIFFLGGGVSGLVSLGHKDRVDVDRASKKKKRKGGGFKKRVRGSVMSTTRNVSAQDEGTKEWVVEFTSQDRRRGR